MLDVKRESRRYSVDINQQFLLIFYRAYEDMCYLADKYDPDDVSKVV